MSDQTEGNEAMKPPLKRGWGRVLLISSLALNLLFVGAMIGGGWMRHKFGSGYGGPPGFVVKRLLGHLPDEKRQSIVDQITAHRAAMKPRINAARMRRSDLSRALHSEPFEEAQVRAAARKLKESRRGMIDAKTDILVSVLTRLTPDERRKILDSHFFRHLFSRHGRGRHWRQ